MVMAMNKYDDDDDDDDNSDNNNNNDENRESESTYVHARNHWVIPEIFCKA